MGRRMGGEYVKDSKTGKISLMHRTEPAAPRQLAEQAQAVSPLAEQDEAASPPAENETSAKQAQKPGKIANKKEEI